MWLERYNVRNRNTHSSMNRKLRSQDRSAYGSLPTLPWIPHGPRRHGSKPYSFQKWKVSTLVAEACVNKWVLEARCIGCTDFNQARSETITASRPISRNSRNHSPAPLFISLMGHHGLKQREYQRHVHEHIRYLHEAHPW